MNNNPSLPISRYDDDDDDERHHHHNIIPKSSAIPFLFLTKKYHRRAVFRSVTLIALVIGYYTYHRVAVTTNSVDGSDDNNNFVRQQEQKQSSSILRHLEEECDLDTIDPSGKIPLFVIGVLYLFLALAIVCDEFFVPALEEMSSEHHLNLSMDIAGATLMAAGGSAPELFASYIGTFQESEVGFGTIVGSAVFNVLFVIAMCSFFAKEELKLTWWPLFRDSTYYTISLILLGVFVGVVSAGEIELWESIILFLLYFGYVIFMNYNRKVYKMITGEEYVDPEELEETDTESTVTDDLSTPLVSDDNDVKTLTSTTEATSTKKSGHNRFAASYRARVLSFLKSPLSWAETAGFGIVIQIAGDVDATFRHVDANGDGFVSREELKTVYEDLGCEMTEEQLSEAFKDLDSNNDGKITEAEFTEYYIRSQERILVKAREVFDTFDEDNSNTIDRTETIKFLTTIDPSMKKKDINEALRELHGDEEDDAAISFEQFSEWYVNSKFLTRQIDKCVEDMEGIWSNLKPPAGGGCYDYMVYIIYLPILVPMTIFIPDVRKPGCAKFCYLSFLMSIVFIGLISFVLVDWLELLGNTAGIPPIIMGLTFMAAGTSIPDLLSSVIVARMGFGDMAVSSSLGSNIFDILVGLPLPWLSYSLIKGKSVSIDANGVFLNLIILVLMVMAVILTIHCNGWKLSKIVGFMMLLFYAAFLVQAILQELPFQMC